MTEEKDDQEEQLSPLAIGYMWSTRIISLSVEMGLIILAFYWLDSKCATAPLFIIFGSLLAIGVFIVQIVAMSKKPVSIRSRTETDDNR